MVPDRLSYHEMFDDTWRYPSKWTESFDSYLHHKECVCNMIIEYMDNYSEYAPLIPQQAHSLHTNFFSATEILKNVI